MKMEKKTVFIPNIHEKQRQTSLNTVTQLRLSNDYPSVFYQSPRFICPEVTEEFNIKTYALLH